MYSIFTLLNGGLNGIFMKLNITFKVHGGFLVGAQRDGAVYGDLPD
jgi:hypothetical protein